MPAGTAQAPTLTHDVTAASLDLKCGGVAPRSTYRVIVHPVECDQEAFKFVGGAGSFSAHHGVNGRTIEWYGTLRVTAAELRAILVAADAMAATAGTLTFVDDYGYTFYNCVFAGPVEIGEKHRVVGDATVDYVAPYRILLRQLQP